MAFLRKKALEIVQNRSKVEVSIPPKPISEYFGELTFGLDEMKATLSPEVYERVSHAIEKGKRIDAESADAVAAAVKVWAIARGVTHYTHWFQPLTGATAEKHDSFFDAQLKLEKFKGSSLTQQEPDASSFPSGGIRSTFEARGYTAWDPSSPMFIMNDTLCIPTIFVSYTGEALDYKAPLLKASEAVDRAATRICKFFDRNVNRVTASLGCEQEYFVVDRAMFDARSDLVMRGKTLFGHAPARGQQLDDHYFGSIPPRIQRFMRDFECEALRLGIPVSTRHNEVAPSQYEVAPTFEEINRATDHNQLMMDIMDKVAERHGLKVLFDEKPFDKLNGTGKHNNWSLITNTGVNLFQPRTSARDNLQFLVFFVCTIKAVHDYADLLRASIASAGNDYRLGANEAPPAIISVFIGSQLTAVLDELESKGNVKVEKGENMYMKLGIDKIPSIILDNTDRNRTSPFAFTGNKFELRAVGGSANVAQPMTVLNLIVADQLTEFANEVDSMVNKGEERRIAMIKVLREYIKTSKSVRFEGDGYSEEWVAEAEKRGLPNIKDTPRSLDAYISEKAKKLYERHNVLNHVELEARHDILLENYIMKIQIESRLMGDLALNHILPAAFKYQGELTKTARDLAELNMDNSSVLRSIEAITKHTKLIQELVEAMTDARRRLNKLEDTRARAIGYCDEVKEAFFEKLRYSVDKLELIVDDELWPLVKYRELLFIK